MLRPVNEDPDLSLMHAGLCMLILQCMYTFNLLWFGLSLDLQHLLKYGVDWFLQFKSPSMQVILKMSDKVYFLRPSEAQRNYRWARAVGKEGKRKRCGRPIEMQLRVDDVESNLFI